MHAKAMTYYAWWYHTFGVLSILLSGAAGTTILTQVSSCNIDPITHEPVLIISSSPLFFYEGFMFNILIFKLGTKLGFNISWNCNVSDSRGSFDPAI